MERVIIDIVDALRAGDVDAAGLERILRRHNKAAGGTVRRYAKKGLMPFYLHVREHEPARWAAWDIDAALEARLLALLQVKPRRTASGVATITVITKPMPCGNDCLYCPNDMRMPKSYLADEPACQRAERCWFDPYLQVSARLRALKHMGHVTDKIELIVLGGTWSDYPESYQRWFVKELFRALNEADAAAEEEGEATVAERRAFYERLGLPNERDDCLAFAAAAQADVNAGRATYNQAWARLYPASEAWQAAAAQQTATMEEVAVQHTANETAAHRVVGLVVETRPDAVTPENLTLMRRLGCTKVQMGVQSLDQRILDANRRNISVGRIARAFELLRIFGFKTHAHFMVNLLGATPDGDKADYRRFATEAPFQPDEVKLYPCALIGGTGLVAEHAAGTWRPYDEETLLGVLVADVLATPAHTRISRMIRDFSAHDIVAGNKKINLRQLVEARIEALAKEAAESGEVETRPSESAPNASPASLVAPNADPASLVALDTSSATSASDVSQAHPASAPDTNAAASDSDADPTASAPAPREPFVREIRFREISTGTVDAADLVLEAVPYATSNTDEVFLQWVAPDGRIAGFLRLSLPHADYVTELREAYPALPVAPDEAMIREVHVYGRVAALHRASGGAQHLGLGRQLIAEAERRAREAGYAYLNVISSVGTREYYRSLGFQDHGLYQRKPLD